MNILGLHINTDQTSAALLSDGKFIAAAAEERFSRIKRSREFPFQAIRHCLKEAGLSGPDELDGIAVSWNPGENMRHINMSGFTSWRRYDPEWLYILPNNIMSMCGTRFQSEVMRLDFPQGPKCAFYFVEHHMAHLAHAVAQCPFEEGLALAADEYGEYHSLTAASFRGDALKILGRTPYPHSLGVFYSALTEYLGFSPNSDEWKVMGAAACGDPGRYREALRSILAWDGALGEWRLDTRLVQHCNLKRAGYLSEDLVAHIGLAPRGAKEELRQEHYDLAAAAQAVFEERLFQVIEKFLPQAPAPNLAAAGGCFMNSLANGRIIEKTAVRNLFVPAAAADNGGAMGSALYVWHKVLGHPRRPYPSPPEASLGPQFTDAEIEAELARCGVSSERVQDVAAQAAQDIHAGRLVGWFQGRMEFGERALGNRSILADPRVAGIKDKINAAVKYREAFRPFAPSVLEHSAPQWFQLPAGALSPYMERVCQVRPELGRQIPAVVHNDGTCRVQTVNQAVNPVFHRLISEFEKLTGVPVVLNTSFNIQGEPIVCSPRDAIRTFFTCGLEVLYIGNQVVKKK